MEKDFCRSGSLSSVYMEPETSSRNTRLESGASPRSIACVFKPICKSFASAFHGQSPMTVVTPNGSPFSGSL